MAAYLIAEEGPLAGITVTLENDQQWILGRDPDEVSITLEDPMVSRKHIIIRLTAEGYRLENLSSVNPVTQNGKVVVDEVLLKEGDILQIGSTFFRFSEKEPAPIDEHLSQGGFEEAYTEDSTDLSSVSFGVPSMARWMMKVISGPNAGAEFPLERGSSYIIGKDPTLCDVIFHDLSVSRQHARIVVDDEEHVFIEDLGSKNGLLINGEIKKEKTPIQSQDLIAVGTTSFLVVDKEQMHETIISPPTPLAIKEEVLTEEKIAEEIENVEKKDWKETIIPTKHLIVAASFCLVLLGLVASTFSLFKTQTVQVHVKHESEQIKEALNRFSDIQFTYSDASGKLFLLGHVLNSVEKQEMLYGLKALPFITSIDDNVVIDEYVWQNMNALLLSNSAWQSVSIYAPTPGRFIMKGYVQTVEQAESLSEYININFPYLDRLQNQVVVENNLNMQIQSLLLEKGFSGVTFQLTAGEIVLSGRVDDRDVRGFSEFLSEVKGLVGIRQVKNFVVYTTAETSRIDISSQYTVSGFSQGSNEHFFVVVNGKVLSMGDVLDGMSITGIQPTVILLEKDGLKFRINYNLQ